MRSSPEKVGQNHSKMDPTYRKGGEDVKEKLSETVLRAWSNDAEKRRGEGVPEDEEVYIRRNPSFKLGRTMFGKPRQLSPEPTEIDSESEPDESGAGKFTPVSSATKPKRECQRETDFAIYESHGRIDESLEEEIIDETEINNDSVSASEIEQIDPDIGMSHAIV